MPRRWPLTSLLLVLALIFPCNFATAEWFNTELARELPDAEYRKLMRSIIMVERSILEKRQDFGKKTITREMEALHPYDAASFCGEAMEAAYFFLRKQGVPGEKLQMFQLTSERGLFGENSFRHVVLVFNTQSRSGKAISVVIDPTFSQIYAYRNDSGSTTFRESLKESVSTPGLYLGKSNLGKAVLKDLEGEGMWLADSEKLKLWGEAMTSDESGNRRPAKLVSIESLARGNILPRITTSEETAQQLAGLTTAGIEAALNAITDQEIRRKVVIGRKAVGRVDCSFLDEKTCRTLNRIDDLYKESKKYDAEIARLRMAFRERGRLLAIRSNSPTEGEEIDRDGVNSASFALEAHYRRLPLGHLENFDLIHPSDLAREERMVGEFKGLKRELLFELIVAIKKLDKKLAGTKPSPLECILDFASLSDFWDLKQSLKN